MRRGVVTKNGIVQLNSGRRTQMAFHIDEGLLRELREMSARTGLTQRAIIEAGARRQLKELHRQINRGQLAVMEILDNEQSINEEL
jgi:hypothetical protein